MPSSYDSSHTNGHSYTNGHSHTNGHQNGTTLHVEDVGIVAMEIYFPNQYVEQSELEKFDNVPAGKNTVGLGQERMGFCNDREDIVSMCLTVVDRLMKRTGTSYKDIGRMEVGTETLIDKSKSIKTCLMRLFEEEENMDVEGVDNLNACYGGTAALFGCLNWINSTEWDGRYGLAVAGDIAVYPAGNARCTGGAGVVAMLIGPNAGLVFDQGVRSSYMRHAYDFYKPNMSCEYPVVDGAFSLQCYMEALDNCYTKFCQKFERKVLRNSKSHRSPGLDSLDFVVFHSPFTKLVQKSLARLVFHDFRKASSPAADVYAQLEQYRSTPLSQTYNDKEFDKLIVKLSQDVFRDKTDTAQRVARNVGNMYTASLYGGVASLIAGNTVETLANKRVGLFSYGSGSAATFFSARFVPSPSLDQLVESFSNLYDRLDQRTKVEPEKYDDILRRKEEQYKRVPPFTPASDVSSLDRNTFYLEQIDKRYQRLYARTESS